MKNITTCCCAFLLAVVSGVISVAAADDATTDRMMVYDFNETDGLGGWEVEDDVVMGGVSSGRLEMRDDGVAVFSGDVSLENDGGFSSVQYFFDPIDISAYKTACLRVKGDGKTYQFIVEAQPDDRHYYSVGFPTGTEWEVVRIPLNSLAPYRRGDRLDIPNFPGQTLSQVRFLIGNAKAEAFQLEIDAIWLE